MSPSGNFAAPARPPRNFWILSSWRDLLLYVGTPLLLIPLFTLAQSRWRTEDIYLFVGAFGATGHHLPGMMRAYADRALFERFRARFIIAPIFLVAVCAAFYVWDLKAIVLVLFFWGVWHGMMQTYGFCRIYDAKSGSFAAVTRRLDFAVCALWFATAVFLSPERMGETLSGFYASGGPFVPASLLHTLQQALLAVSCAATALFVANFIRSWRNGQPANPIKVALLATSIAFWWYCNNGVVNILAGIALFEVFHDVQYLSIVWVYNRNRVEKDRTIGGFMRFVFRRSGALIGLYIGLVFAYGAFAYMNSQLEITALKRLLTGVLAASALLHFYYDGFIWKVRESSTRSSLGLNGGTADAPAQNAWLGSLLHASKWAVGFALPVGLLCFWQLHSTISNAERAKRLVASLPRSVTARYGYALALEQEHKPAEAMSEFQKVIAAKPSHAEAHYHVALLLRDQAKYDPSLAELDRAIQLDPANGEYHFRAAETLQRIGHLEEAATRYAEAARLSPKVTTAHIAYAEFLAGRGDFDAAVREYQTAVRIDPHDARVRARLGDTFVALQRLDDAKREYSVALQKQPDLASAHNNLGQIYSRQGDVTEALNEFAKAAALDPENATFRGNLQTAQELGSSGRTSLRSPEPIPPSSPPDKSVRGQ